jgi:DNA-binding NtrC family response regulator
MKDPAVLSGIYKIQSTIHPDRFYIGSARNIKGRWQLHISEVRKRKVINITTNEIFNSIGDAANYLGIKYQTLYAQLSGHNINKTSLKFS